MPLLVDYGQLLYFVFLEDVGSLLQVGRLRGRNQVVFGHHLVDQTVEVALETQVAVGYDTYQYLVLVDYGDTADVVFAHHRQSLAYRRAATDGHGVVNHTVFGTFHGVYLPGLGLDAHVFMNHANAAFAGDSDCQLCFGNGIHGRRN